MWSSSPIIAMFGTDKVAKASKGPPVVKEYLKKDGTRGYTGDGKKLKQTEQLDLHYGS